MSSIDIGLYIVYVVFGIAVIAAVLLPFINAIKSPVTLVKSLAGVGLLVLLFFVGYALSNGDVTPQAIAQGVTESSSKIIGAGLLTFYFVFLAAAIGVIFSEINKAIK
ncbi:MAG: hypothetical protein KF775_02010 [Cyclobacteriaceae bacterium]|nr:hypothetical protein [Cyclobacteriaceae bacterium]